MAGRTEPLIAGAAPSASERASPGVALSRGVRRFRDHLVVRHRYNWILLGRFCLVGSSGVLVNLLVFCMLLQTGRSAQEVVVPLAGTEFNVRWYHVFSMVAFVLANLWNFQLNRTWSFKSTRRARWGSEYRPFLGIGLAVQALGLLVLTALLHPHSPASLPLNILDGSSLVRSRELWAQGVTIGLVTPVSFVANKLWTFRAVRHLDRPWPHRLRLPPAER